MPHKKKIIKIMIFHEKKLTNKLVEMLKSETNLRERSDVFNTFWGKKHVGVCII